MGPIFFLFCCCGVVGWKMIHFLSVFIIIIFDTYLSQNRIQFKMVWRQLCLPKRSLASQLWKPFKYIASSPFRAFKAFAVVYFLSVLTYLVFGTAVGYVSRKKNDVFDVSSSKSTLIHSLLTLVHDVCFVFMYIVYRTVVKS